MALNKAPVTNGFSVAIFRECWGIIKANMMDVINCSKLVVPNFNIINTTNIALLLKKKCCGTC